MKFPFRGLGVFLFVLAIARAGEPEFRNGDIIFQRSNSSQCEAITAATRSRYTHVGIVLFENGQPYVFEAIQPVTKTPLTEWIKRGENKHFVLKRLDPEKHTLTPKEVENLKDAFDSFQGKDYDWQFGWSDDRIYCSELVWKIYRNALKLELCPLRQLRDFDLDHPSVQKLMQERYGDNFPYTMEAVSPADLFNSPLLRTVVGE